MELENGNIRPLFGCYLLIIFCSGLEKSTGGFTVKAGLAKMTKGGLIMDVVNAEQAKIAEDAGVGDLMPGQLLELVVSGSGCDGP